jgi:hypothetical protein
VAFADDTTFEARMKHLRKGMRVNSRVPVAIEWSEEGRTMRAEGATLDVSPKGCLAVIPQGFAVGQRLRLINLTNQTACQCVLAWRGHERSAGWELGLQLEAAPPDFWGLDF